MDTKLLLIMAAVTLLVSSKQTLAQSYQSTVPTTSPSPVLSTRPPPVFPPYKNSQSARVRQQQCGIPNNNLKLITDLQKINNSVRTRMSETSDRIFGGSDFPNGAGSLCWQVSITQTNLPATNMTRWSGSIIGSRTILTSAHNLHNLFYRLGGEDFKFFDFSQFSTTVTTGVISRDRFSVTNTHPDVVQGCSRNYKVAQYIIHPEYDEGTLDNDIAIIILNEDIDFRQFGACTCKICLMDKAPSPGETCVVSGWGSEVNTSLPNVTARHPIPLKYLGQKILDQADPTCPYSRYNETSPYITNGDLVLCAGGVVGEDTCSEDGGDPFICYDSENNVQYLAGYNVFGTQACAVGGGNMFTKVKTYLTWIFNTAPLGDISILESEIKTY